MSLYDYCRAPKHQVGRERLLHMRVAFEMKLHAAISQQPLLVTEPEIDDSGYDFAVAVSREFDQLFIQSKSALSETGAKSWNIRGALLQPSWHDLDIVPSVDGSPIGTFGATGGVLLQIIDEAAAKNDELKITYFYFDVFFALGVAFDLWLSPNFSSEDAFDLLRRIQNVPDLDARLSIPKAAFLPIKSPAAIVALRLHLPTPCNYVSGINFAAKLRQRGKREPDFMRWADVIRPWATEPVA